MDHLQRWMVSWRSWWDGSQWANKTRVCRKKKKKKKNNNISIPCSRCFVKTSSVKTFKEFIYLRINVTVTEVASSHSISRAFATVELRTLAAKLSFTQPNAVMSICAFFNFRHQWPSLLQRSLYGFTLWIQEISSPSFHTFLCRLWL